MSKTASLRPEHQICRGCGLADDRVEAGGVWYCPNEVCTATGAQTHRMKLPSFRNGIDHHIVDAWEVIAHGEALLVGELDPAMRAAVERSLAGWRRSAEEIQR